MLQSSKNAHQVFTEESLQGLPRGKCVTLTSSGTTKYNRIDTQWSHRQLNCVHILSMHIWRTANVGEKTMTIEPRNGCMCFNYICVVFCCSSLAEWMLLPPSLTECAGLEEVQQSHAQLPQPVVCEKPTTRPSPLNMTSAKCL